jgi:hypothetical protein
MSVSTQHVADRYLKKAGLSKTAGEVRFIKDRGGDKNEWGWGSPGPIEREIQEDFEYKPKNMKPLAETLRAALLAMGHALSAHATFSRIKSAQVSPDGSLGGKGYIQKIPDMRRQLMNVCEAMSSLTDTLYDEIKAPHWDPAVKSQGKRERDEVKNIMNDVDEIREDPEGFAEKEEAEMDEGGNAVEDSGGAITEGGDGPSGKYARQKLASLDPMPIRVAARYLELMQAARQ